MVISGGGSGNATTVCGRCGLSLFYSERRKTWLSKDSEMYCPNPDKLKLGTIHKPVAGEPR